jgi:hypothetical protein
MKITYRKTAKGNYVGRCGKYYIFMHIRKHYVIEGFQTYRQWYTVYIVANKELVASEGVFSSSLGNIKKAKKWVREKLLDIA